MNEALRVTVDQRALERALKRLDKYQGRLLHQRAQKAYLEGARLMVRPIQAHITAAGLVKTQRFRRSVKARRPRLQGNEMAVASVGPVDAKRHLLIRGHRIVTRGGRDTGRHTQPRPVVDEAFSDVGERVKSFINEQVTNIGGELRAL